MNLAFEETIKKIINAYSAYYNLNFHDNFNQENNTLTSDGLFMDGIFHMHSENYVISKKAQLYQLDTNEYLYFYHYDNLTKDILEKSLNEAYDLGFPNIKPNKDHRSSFITAVFLCESCDDDAVKMLKKYRKRQSFQFSLHGWMECHAILVDLRSGSIINNGDGHHDGKFMKNILHPKKRWGVKLF